MISYLVGWLSEFEELLDDEDSKESAWQNLFERHPFILTHGLSLDVAPEALIPCKPGEALADFYFYPADGSLASPYGVTELKRPSTQLLRVPRKDVICLSADATAAIAQATQYADELDGELKRTNEGLVILGNRLHTFVIAGLSDEIARKITTDILRDRAAKLLPRGCDLIPFDTLMHRFAANVPPRLHVLVPGMPAQPRRKIGTPYEQDRGFRPRVFFGGPRKMYPAACTECIHLVWVPFRPATGRPVFCRDCYTRQKEARA